MTEKTNVDIQKAVAIIKQLTPEEKEQALKERMAEA